MPSYSYRCVQCSQIDTVIHGMQEDPMHACSACGGFTERHIGKAPTVLSSGAEPVVSEETPAPAEQPTCAMHQIYPHQHGPNCKHS